MSKLDFFSAAETIFRMDEGDGAAGKPGQPYRDSNGHWTIGIGHYIGDNLADLRLSPNVMRELFIEDLAKHIREARLVVGSQFFDKLVPARQMALVIMLFTLGKNRFLKFDETIEAILKEDWQSVHDHILATKWARDVDPKQRINEGRDDRVALMFLTGQFHPYYGLNS